MNVQRVIAGIQVAPTPAGTPEDPHAFVEAAVRDSPTHEFR